jgi:hypothetical protein
LGHYGAGRFAICPAVGGSYLAGGNSLGPPRVPIVLGSGGATRLGRQLGKVNYPGSEHLKRFFAGL